MRVFYIVFGVAGWIAAVALGIYWVITQWLYKSDDNDSAKT